MDTLKIFFSEFWPPFIGASVGVSFVWLLHRSGSGASLPLLNEKAFAEIVGYPKGEQKRLLHEASAVAFRRWRSLVPLAVLAFFMATGGALARTLPQVTTIPDTRWVKYPVVMVFAVFGGWLARELTTRYVRPFLRTCLEKRSVLDNG